MRQLLLPFNWYAKFWAKVQKSNGCWEWVGSKRGGGYGQYRGEGAHRVSWVIHYGEIPTGLQVCHKCDNPSCVRPDHLFLGTAEDNRKDASKKGLLRHPAKSEYGKDLILNL